MNFEELKQFTKQTHWGYLATTDGKTVGVRPMGGLMWKDNQLLCATFTPSDKIKQLEKVPYAEYCFCDSTGKHVRVAGKCSISTDNAEKLWLYKQVPELAKYFPDPAMPEYVIIKMIPDNIRAVSGTDMAYEQIKI
ncbi:MAG: pyridoxamine 5'-phosphate oxidase family protein [Planctomycetaceae bacterium]|nr:pyridoxamine 5'-phosphate oxidase family protein [Planctomycetaceae bacterium]